ncbi:MAG: hypothetical protein HRU03_08560 [Nanoarchaeales archaeon]|nr:hypothetical protein [Nanoarchaeales archaeon]
MRLEETIDNITTEKHQYIPHGNIKSKRIEDLGKKRYSVSYVMDKGVLTSHIFILENFYTKMENSEISENKQLELLNLASERINTISQLSKGEKLFITKGTYAQVLETNEQYNEVYNNLSNKYNGTEWFNKLTEVDTQIKYLYKNLENSIFESDELLENMANQFKETRAYEKLSPKYKTKNPAKLYEKGYKQGEKNPSKENIDKNTFSNEDLKTYMLAIAMNTYFPYHKSNTELMISHKMYLQQGIAEMDDGNLKNPVILYPKGPLNNFKNGNFTNFMKYKLDLIKEEK